MANNIMWLVNRRTGSRFALAKYYPSTGWYVIGTLKEINKAFDAEDFPASDGGNRPAHSVAGLLGDEWDVQFESVFYSGEHQPIGGGT